MALVAEPFNWSEFKKSRDKVFETFWRLMQERGLMNKPPKEDDEEIDMETNSLD